MCIFNWRATTMLIAYQDADVCSHQRSNWMLVNRKPTWGKLKNQESKLK